MLKIYLLTRIGVLSSLFTLSFAIGVALMVVFMVINVVMMVESDQDSADKISKRTKSLKSISLTLLIAGGIGSVLCPTRKEMLMIYGGGTILEYCQNNDELKKIPDNAVRTINLLMEEYIDEMNENDKNK